MTVQPIEKTITTEEAKTSWDIKKYAHIVSPPENVGIFRFLVGMGNPDPSARDIVATALEYGWWVTAICGYTWIPTSDGGDHDACQICMDVAGMHMRNAGE